MSFEKGREVVQIKKTEMDANQKTGATGTTRTKPPLPKVYALSFSCVSIA